MIDLQSKHHKMIMDILQKYPYTFYAYGSRVKGTAEKFSDLDLCLMDQQIAGYDLSYIKEELEESDLPFDVDVTPWGNMNKDFQNLILHDLHLMSPGPKFLDAENNLFAKFAYLPLKFDHFVQDKEDLLRIDCNLKTSMFNITCNAKFTKEDAEQKIKEIIKQYNSKPFAWWIGPSGQPVKLGQALEEAGFVKETNEIAMYNDLSLFEPFKLSDDIEIKQVKDKQGVRDYLDTLSAYDEHVGAFFENEQLFSEEIMEKHPLFVSYINDKPVGNGALFFHGMHDKIDEVLSGIRREDRVVGIYDIITQEEYRGRGVGSNMMKYLMNFAHAQKYKKMCLSASSSEGLSIYSKLGFKIVGMFECYEWAGK